MSKEQLIEYICTKLDQNIPNLTQTHPTLKNKIAEFIDAFLEMYPAHEKEIASDPTHDYEYREIALFAIAEFTEFYTETVHIKKVFSVTEIISRFLFARHASLVGLRTHTGSLGQYPVQGLDTSTFKFSEHESLVQKLTYCPVGTLSLIMPANPGKNVLCLYANSLHSGKLNPKLKRIEFSGLECNSHNGLLIDNLLKNTDRLPHLRITVVLPDWDKLPPSDLITTYHHLQNHIRDNQKTYFIEKTKGPRNALPSLSEILELTQSQRAPEFFSGDHNQFQLMAPNQPETWPLFDRYMATRQTSTTCVYEEEFNQFLGLLKTWATTQGMQMECAAALFDPTQFTPENAKALGQLFNSLDAQQRGSVGTSRWIQTVNSVWTTFGKDHFFAWKACVLDTSQHWMDCVEARQPVVSASGSPNRIRRASLNHFEMSWFQLIRIQIRNATRLDSTHIHYVQTMLNPDQRNRMFGKENQDLQIFLTQLSLASENWLEFFQDPSLFSTFAYISCAHWVDLLKDEIPNYLPIFGELFKDVQDIELCTLGMWTLTDAIKAQKTCAQALETLRYAHRTAIAYQRFIAGRSKAHWQPQLYKDTVEWNAIYFETLNHAYQRKIPEPILEATLQAEDIEEVNWMLALGQRCAHSEKAHDTAFHHWITTLLCHTNSLKYEFIHIIFSQANAPGFHLDLDSLEYLWCLWVTQRLDTEKTLMYLAQTTLNLQTLKTQAEFMQYVKNAQKRQLVMGTLSHNLVILNQSLRDQCYRWYKACLQHWFVWIDWASAALGYREASYQHGYRILAQIIQDLQFAHDPSAAPSTTPCSDAFKVKYHALFAQYQAQYAGFFWSCNRTRINQAQHLFKQLQGVTAPHRQAYYETVLGILMQQQIDIVTADQTYYFYAPNRKGHSRLYDLCTELFLTLSRDCLCDPDLSEAEKAFVQPLLQAQLQHHIALLAKHIPELTPYKTGSIDQQALHLDLMANKARIPAQYQCLYRSLVWMTGVQEEQSLSLQMT